MKKIYIFIALCIFFLPRLVEAGTITDIEEKYEVNDESYMMLSSTPTLAMYGKHDYNFGLFDLYSNYILSEDVPSVLKDNKLTTQGEIRMDNNKKYTINFTRDIKITGIFLGYRPNQGGRKMEITFYDGDDALINKKDIIFDGRVPSQGSYFDNEVENVRKIVIQAKASMLLYEIDFFVDPSFIYSSVSGIVANPIRDTSATISWQNPKSDQFNGNKVYLDDKLIEDKSKEPITSIALKDLEPEKEYRVTVVALYGNIEISAKYSFKTIRDKTPPGDVKNLIAKQIGDTVVLEWENPTDEDFSHVRITKGGMFLADKVEGKSYVDENAKMNADISYRVITADGSNNYSPGVTVSIKTMGTEIYGLSAKASDAEKVELKWENPQRNDFEMVRISRKNTNSGFMSKVVNFFGTNDEYTDLFQTNGTVFNDLTVNPDTEYTYRLRSVIAGVESSGVTINVKTPKISVSGGGTDVDNEGHYVVKWNTPVTGKIKVLIARKEYAIVPAADKKIIIPKEEMKFDLLGNPDVQLIPIDEEGNEGLPSKPGGGGNNNGGGIGGIIGGGTDAAEITPENTLDMAVGLFLLVGGFLLLGMSFWLVPKLIRVIRQALGNKNGQTEIGRRTS